MRSALSLTVAALVISFSTPASAQMCSAGQTTGSTGTTAQAGGMCGMMRPAATDPMNETRSPSQQGQRQAAWPCCQMMAMMGGGGMGGMGGMMGGQRPSQQQPTTPSTPQTNPPAMPNMPGMETPQPRPQQSG